MLPTSPFNRWPYKRGLPALVGAGMALSAISTAFVGAMIVSTVILAPVPRASAAPPAQLGEQDSATAVRDQAAWIAAYKKLSREKQLGWLENLLRDRTERAAALVQTDADFAELHHYNTEVLRRARAGKSLSTRGLESLLASADAMERRAIEHLALRYRSAAYATFRTERREYDLRVEAWRRVEFAWRLAGRHPHEQSRLIDWLAESVNRFEHGRFDLLPARPKFGNTVTEMVAAARPPATVPLSPAPIAPSPAAAVLRSAARRPSPAPIILSPAPITPNPAPVMPSGTPIILSPAAATQLPRAAFQALPKVSPAAVAAASESVAAGESVAAPVSPPPAAGARRVPRGSVEASERPTLPATVAVKAETRSRRGDPSDAVRAVNQPPVLPVETVERAIAKVAPSAAPTTARPRAAAAVAVAPKRTGPSALPVSAPDIDLAELRDRLAGYKLALAGLNGQLHEPGLVGASRLATIVNELEELITRRGDLMLYLQLVADHGGKTERLESPSAALSLVSAKISATRLFVEEQRADALLPKHQAELASLDQLSRELAVLAVQLQEQQQAK